MMKFPILVLISFCLFFCVNAVSYFDLIKEEWNDFKLQYNKSYSSEIEEKFRMKIFVENRYKIAQHNQKFNKNQVSFKLGVNKYADLLPHEFVANLNGFNQSKSTGKTHYKNNTDEPVSFLPAANVELPPSIDWRTKGAVTPIKNQGMCGSCWSFSATGALEGQHFRKTGKLVSLSEQNLVDCSDSYGNEGCNGGLMDNAFKYIKDNGGIDTEKTYPYKGIDGRCHFNPQNVGATDKGFVDVPAGDENALQNAVATVGPVSVAIDASQDSFQFYKEGVYYEKRCSSVNLDHGVLAVGYGTDKSGQDYWLVKNSWGTDWGDEGYIKMSRNKHNNCGIASMSSYPLV